jgi:LPS export ABC transporter protein LptC
MMIFLFFKPLEIKKQEFVDVPLLNIDKFTMYEFNREGLQTVMKGEETLRYSDRYTVSDINFTDYSEDFKANMSAKEGLYKGNTVNLEGNVTYHREDGLAFKSKTLLYNTKTAIAVTNDKYIANFGVSTMQGETLNYNSKSNKIKSKNVSINYKLNERK